ncbi:MAG: hypothetical protein K2M98_06255 [Muribaculum sp.]|nr:hypothetical protein [Muribaculum sp.]
MKKIILAVIAALSVMTIHAKTLVVYYSYTNNVHTIVSELTKQIDADVIRVEPAEKGLDYAANNYAIGSMQIDAIRKNPSDASSYPEIDPIDVNISDYDCIIIGAPLWWSNMASPLQSFLFKYGKEMAGKHIGLIVLSASSGINGVVGDAKRLIPDGNFFSEPLWIRSSQTANCSNLIWHWLADIDYGAISGIDVVADGKVSTYTVYSVSGSLIGQNLASIDNLVSGPYIINGIKWFKRK